MLFTNEDIGEKLFSPPVLQHRPQPEATGYGRSWTAKPTPTEWGTWKCHLNTQCGTCQGGRPPFYPSKAPCTLPRASYWELFPKLTSSSPIRPVSQELLTVLYMPWGFHHTGLWPGVCLRLPSTPTTLLRYQSVGQGGMLSHTDLLALWKPWWCCLKDRIAPCLSRALPLSYKLGSFSHTPADLLAIITNTLGLPNNRGP